MNGTPSQAGWDTVSSMIPATIRPLVPGSDAAPFADLTFPSYRSLIEKPHANVLAVGAFAPHQVGLALAKADGPVTVLLSLQTVASHRRKGIGGAMLAAIENLAAEAGTPRIETSYRSGTPGTEAFEATLAAAKWSPPAVRQIFCRASPRMLESTWARTYTSPPDYTVIHWSDVTDADRAALRASQAENPWFPESLDPLVHEKDFEPLTSIALRARSGELVGWLITHRLDDLVIRYTCSFLRPELQGMARIVGLYIEATRRQTAALGPKTSAVWTIPVIHPRMAAFARRRMAPWLDEFAEFRTSHHDLTNPPKTTEGNAPALP
jgi:GNAT superfamily N-acetyltransferase